jgi:hypothetical protein
LGLPSSPKINVILFGKLGGECGDVNGGNEKQASPVVFLILSGPPPGITAGNPKSYPQHRFMQQAHAADFAIIC